MCTNWAAWIHQTSLQTLSKCKESDERQRRSEIDFILLQPWNHMDIDKYCLWARQNNELASRWQWLSLWSFRVYQVLNQQRWHLSEMHGSLADRQHHRGVQSERETYRRQHWTSINPLLLDECSHPVPRGRLACDLEHRQFVKTWPGKISWPAKGRCNSQVLYQLTQRHRCDMGDVEALEHWWVRYTDSLPR